MSEISQGLHDEERLSAEFDSAGHRMTLHDAEVIRAYLKEKRSSYHDTIQVKARSVEQDRGKTYDNTREVRLTLRETEYAMGAVYKLLRIINDTHSTAKAMDDALDAYNYCALLYGAFERRRDFTPENAVTTDGERR